MADVPARAHTILGQDLALLCLGDASATPPLDLIARCVATLHASIDVVPMRIGAPVANACDAAALLAQAEPSLAASLSRIRGRTEYTARLLIEVKTPGPAATRVGTGAGYLAARARRYAELDGIPPGMHALINDWVARLEISGIEARLDGPTPLLPHPAAHFLVPRSAAPLFVERFNIHRASLGGPALLTGPWAPFNFV
ncbi:MAG: GvpL/GvpF family gas vesicle protein [Planctomycetota bacterium]|nr:GvpL/GvpF family gas vesicle protein [Planctomycetota bacterium]